MKYKTYEDIQTAKELISCPGDTLLDTINARGISQTELALRMGRPLKTINEIINGKTAITPETAIQLSRVVGTSPEFWLNYERNYRLELAEIQECEQLLESKDWVSLFPLSEMSKLNWISFENNLISKTNALYSYFSVANKDSFDKYYTRNLIPALFRSSTTSKTNPYAVVSWIRKGDLQAQDLKAPVYDQKKFKSSLVLIKKLMAEQPEDFFPKLQSICLESGVKVVYTPCLPKAPVHGVTRWLNDNPLIQLTGRYKRNDIFWFTFFHEVGHIILHGKKDIFIEGIEPDVDKIEKEKQADDFAIDWTLTFEEEKIIMQDIPYFPEKITHYANVFGTHESLIFGRFTHNKIFHDSDGWSLRIFKKVELL